MFVINTLLIRRCKAFMLLRPKVSEHNIYVNYLLYYNFLCNDTNELGGKYKWTTLIDDGTDEYIKTGPYGPELDSARLG